VQLEAEPAHGDADHHAVLAQQDEILLPAAETPLQPAVADEAPAAPTQSAEVVAEPQRVAPVTSLDDLVGIEPIAEALIKTLAGKARTGRLDEMKALELLRQIVSL
jgi:hypothetical protein